MSAPDFQQLTRDPWFYSVAGHWLNQKFVPWNAASRMRHVMERDLDGEESGANLHDEGWAGTLRLSREGLVTLAPHEGLEVKR